MRVDVLMFARLKEILGTGQLTIDSNEMLTVRDVWKKLCTEHSEVSDFEENLLLSVNHEFASWDSPIQDGDELGFFPPVSGGAFGTETLTYPMNASGDVIELVQEPIDLHALAEQLKQPQVGAIVSFDGIVRNHSNNRTTLYLEYEAYNAMALKKMSEIAAYVKRHFPVDRIGMVHRLGRLEIGETSVVIVVTGAHRLPAFEACQYAIDTLKQTVPIWKKEFFEDGEVWVDGKIPQNLR